MNPSLSAPNTYNSSYKNTFLNPVAFQQLPSLDQAMVPASILTLILNNANQGEFNQFFLAKSQLGLQLQQFAQQLKQAMQYNAEGKTKACWTIPWQTNSGSTVVLTPSQLLALYYAVFANYPGANFMNYIIYRYRLYYKSYTLMRIKINDHLPYLGQYIGNNYDKQYTFY
jgi:hypothetical protein